MPVGFSSSPGYFMERARAPWRPPIPVQFLRHCRERDRRQGSWSSPVPCPRPGRHRRVGLRRADELVVQRDGELAEIRDQRLRRRPRHDEARLGHHLIATDAELDALQGGYAAPVRLTRPPWREPCPIHPA